MALQSCVTLLMSSVLPDDELMIPSYTWDLFNVTAYKTSLMKDYIGCSLLKMHFMLQPYFMYYKSHVSSKSHSSQKRIKV